MMQKIQLSFYRFLYKPITWLFHLIFLTRSVISRRIYTYQFDQRDDDVFIVTYMKSGTTVLQSLVYQLLTDGNMSFNHIYEVSPFLEASFFYGHSLKNVSCPRILKTHFDYKEFPKTMKGKFIYCLRNGMDVAVSKYHHEKNYSLPNLEWNVFLENNFFKSKPFDGKTWFEHVSDWFKNKNKYMILYIRFEDIINNKYETVKRIADFLDVPLTEERYARIRERTSFEFMKKHEDKFGLRPPDDKRVYDQFIREGNNGHGVNYFSEEQKMFFELLKKKYFKDISIKDSKGPVNSP